MGVERLMPFAVDGGAIVVAAVFCVMVNGDLGLLRKQNGVGGVGKTRLFVRLYLTLV